jgi:hypothetical protein
LRLVSLVAKLVSLVLRLMPRNAMKAMAC